MLYDVMIIGAGPAGMTAAIYAARANLKVLLLEKLAPGGQIINTHEIQNYTGIGKINGVDLAYKMFEHTKQLQVAFEYGTVERVEIDGDVKKAICIEGQVFEAKALVLATGTIPKKLKVANEERFSGENISWCAVCDGAYYKDKDVVIIGGGKAAIQEALYLATLAKSMVVIAEPKLTAEATVVQKLRALDNVTIYEGYHVDAFLGDDVLTGVQIVHDETKEEKVITCDGVFEYIGLDPSTKAFEALDVLDEEGYIKVSESMETSISGIFAAGDVVAKQLRQVVTACSDGAIAAQSVARYIEDLTGGE